jgi:hypothetical protein
LSAYTCSSARISPVNRTAPVAAFVLCPVQRHIGVFDATPEVRGIGRELTAPQADGFPDGAIRDLYLVLLDIAADFLN